MRRIPIAFFEFGVVTNFMQKSFNPKITDYFFTLKLYLIAAVLYINNNV